MDQLLLLHHAHFVPLPWPADEQAILVIVATEDDVPPLQASYPSIVALSAAVRDFSGTRTHAYTFTVAPDQSLRRASYALVDPGD